MQLNLFDFPQQLPPIGESFFQKKEVGREIKQEMGQEAKQRVKLTMQQMVDDFQKELPYTWGEKYLQKVRHLQPEVYRLYGIGYAEEGKWPHTTSNGKPIRQWKFGRITIPCTNPAGKIINFYGRAVGSNEKVPEKDRHDFLPGETGIFNAKALCEETVYICQSPFDALSIITAGLNRACAVFRPDNVRWEEVKAKTIVFCVKQKDLWIATASKGVLEYEKEVFFLADSFFGSYHDINAVWVATKTLDFSKVVPYNPNHLTENKVEKPETWNDEKAEKLLSESMARAKAGYILGAFEYAEKCRGELIKRWDDAEKQINRAFETQDIGKVREALTGYEKIISLICTEYKKFCFTPGAAMPI